VSAGDNAGRPQGERDRIAVRVRGGAVVPGFGELVENRLMGKTGFFGGVACLFPPPMPGAGLPDGLQQRLPVTGLIVRLIVDGLTS